MKCTLPLSFAAACACACAQDAAPAPAPVPAAAPASPPPRLVVLCSVDQLATWVFEAARPHLRPDGGFRRLLDHGVDFPQCAYVHACTETGPGHATLGTGAPASVHGIVKNEWYDRDAKAKVYCVGDATAAGLPGFPEGRARSAARLRVPTVGDLLQQRNADSVVVSISHKDRSAILMGGVGADEVVWFENTTGRFVTNACWGAEAPAWLEALDREKPADALFGWTWDRFGPEAAYAGCVDDQPFEVPHPSTGARTLPVAIKGGRHDDPTAAFYLEAYMSPIADLLVARAVHAALAGTRLGRDDVPDLLCVSFSAVDIVGHYFGPEGVEARDTLLRLDVLLAELMAALDRDVGEGRWALVLSADHGVGPTPEAAKARGLDAGRDLLHTKARNAVEVDLREHFGVDAKKPFVLHAGEYSLYLDRARIEALAKDGDGDKAFATACDVAAAAVAKVPGIAQGIAVPRLLAEGPGDDPIHRAVAASLYDGRSGDVAIVVKPYWLEGVLPPASHGTPHDYDRQVVLLAMGPGLRAAHRSMAAVSPGLAAVFAAHWLGLPPLAAAADTVPDDARAR